jgi:apolipoprotein N-acyltransferase
VTAKGLEEAPGSPDVVIWPETAYPEYYDQNFFRTYSGIRLTSYIKKNDFNLITGVFAHTDENKTANAALFLNKNAEPVGDPIYKKILLMFGEYIPGEKTFPVLRKVFPMVGDFARGDEPMVKDFDGVRLGVQICYEGLFPWFSRELVNKGSQIFVNLTNDSWYGPYAEPQQHLYLSAFRAIENRQPLIRATNTGISTVVTADGSFLEKSPIYAQWAGYYEVPYSSEQKKTVYQQWGYAIPLPLTLILFIISLFYEPKKRADERKVENTKI